MRVFKAVSSQQIRQSGNKGFGWQSDYYDRIVRNEGELLRIRDYIEANPAHWGEDPENSDAALPRRRSEEWEV